MNEISPFKVLRICGSLRRASITAGALRRKACIRATREAPGHDARSSRSNGSN